MIDYKGNFKEEMVRNKMINSTTNTIVTEIGRTKVDEASGLTEFLNFVKMLDSLTIRLQVSSVHIGKTGKFINAEIFSGCLIFLVEMAKKTFKATTDLGIRTNNEPMLTRK